MQTFRNQSSNVELPNDEFTNYESTSDMSNDDNSIDENYIELNPDPSVIHQILLVVRKEI